MKGMKITANVFLLLASMSMLASCEPIPVREGRKIYEMYYEKTLIDPVSFKVYKEEYEQKDGNEVEWTLDMGAKNRMGAMIRRTERFSTWGYRGGGYIDIDDKWYKREDLE